MVDIVSLLRSFDFGPSHFFFLLSIFFLLSHAFSRIEKIEAVHNKLSSSIAFMKGILNITEEKIK